MKIGKSQQKVLDYICFNPGTTTKEIGDSLYDKVSSCASWKNTQWSKEKIRYHWAANLVRFLIKKDLIFRTDVGLIFAKAKEI